MFQVNDDLSIYATRGDGIYFDFSIEEDGVARDLTELTDIIRFTVYGKKDAETIFMQKDFMVSDVITADPTIAVLSFTSDEMTFGDVISKPTDYWYEIEINPDTDFTNTIIGYDDENGAKVFRLYPESAVI
jgi:hypothetical protein